MRIINHLCTYAHQTELSVCFAQIIAEQLRRSNLLIDYLWSPYVIGQTIIFSSCFFFLSSIFFFFSRLISAVADWMSTILVHMVWP